MIDKSIRINEIAEKAGVSPSTVSRVLNHPENVSSKTTSAIKQAMEELGIDLSVLLRMKDDKTESKVIIYCVPDIQNPFFDKVFSGIRACAETRSYTVLLHVGSISEKNINTFIKIVRQNSVSGVILTTNIDSQCIRMINDLVPVVQCSNTSQDPVSKVAIDEKEAAKEAVRYLTAGGHHKIAFVGSTTRSNFSRLRKEGYLEALQEADLEINENLLISLPRIDFETALTAVKILLTGPNKPDAVFGVSDIIAAATVNAAKQSGLRIPEDLAVIGFDNVSYSIISRPTITSVSVPCYQLGFSACELLIEKINNPRVEIKEVILKTELIVRESS